MLSKRYESTEVEKVNPITSVIRPMTPDTSRTAEGSDENVRNVIRHCLE